MSLVPTSNNPAHFPDSGLLNTAHKLASSLAATEFVPRTLRGRTEAVMAAMLTGRELGIGPMAALQGIHVVDGKPTMSGELMRAVVQRAGHTVVPRVVTSERVVMYGKRADDGSELEIEWTMDDAKRAGLAGRGPWKSYPRAMLTARATSELCRALFPDCLCGVSYVPEELGADVDGDGEPIGVVAAPAPAAPVAPVAASEVIEDAEIIDADIIEDAEVIDPLVSEDWAETAPALITDAQRAAIYVAAENAGVPAEEMRSILATTYNVDALRKLTTTQAAELLADLSGKVTA